MAREKFIESLKSKAEHTFNEFNALKGGSQQVLEQADSNKAHFRYDVFRRQTFSDEYIGISKLVREKLNDPNFFNKRLKKIGNRIRVNIKKREE